MSPPIGNSDKGPVAIVTGSGSGIGRATTLLLAERGYRVVGADIDGDAAAMTEATAASSVAVQADITTGAGAARVVREAVGRFGDLDVLVNVVGGSRPGEPVEGITEESWRKWLDINLTSTFLMCKYAVPALSADGGGAIVNISSGAALRGMRLNVAYCAAKAGVIGLTRALAIDLADRGIRVNCIAPGPIQTELMERNRTPEQIAGLGAISLLGRIGTPGEVAEAIAFLAGEASSYVNGQVISVDGGVSTLV